VYQAADLGRAAGGADFLSAGELARGGLRVQLLGDFRVRAGDRYVENFDWQLRRAKSALKLLTIDERHRMHREEMMTVLWPSLSADAAANNLHKALYVIRHTLEPELRSRASSRYVRLRGEFVELTTDGEIQTDIKAFSDAAHWALATRDARACTEALRLYVGDLLPEDLYEEWTLTLRDQLRALRVDVLLLGSRLRGDEGNLEEAIALAQLAIAADPLNEDAHAHLVLLLAQKGQRHLALQHYRQYQANLRDELGVDPGERAVEVVKQVVGDQVPARPVVTAMARHRRMRRHSSLDPLPLFGRDTDVAKIERLIDALYKEEGGVVLVRGEGGIGKSAVVTAVASRASQAGTAVTWLTDDEIPVPETDRRVRKTLLIVDDPDEDYVELVREFIVADPGRVVALITVEADDESEAAARRLTDGLHGLKPVCRVTLEPLSDGAVELIVQAQLGAQMSPDVVDWLQELAQGNPHYVREGISALLGRSAVACVNGRWTFAGPPPDIERSNLRRPHGHEAG